jgi:Ser/Thr protein kinase RdoA (MazF antagonist)
LSKRQGYESKVTIPIDRLVDRVSIAYGRPFRISEAPRNGYRSTVLFLAESSEFVLKVFDPGVGLERVVESTRVLVELSKLELPVIPPVPREDGALYGDVAGQLCALYQRASGSPHDPTRDDQLVAGGVALARAHAVKIPLDVPKIRAEDWARGIHAAPTLPSCVSIDMVTLPMDHWGEGDEVLLHGDYRAQNVLYDEETVSCILDWDDASRGDRLLDLAYSLVFFRAVIAEGAPSAEAMACFIQGYQVIRPLTPAEWDRLPQYLGLALRKGLALWSRIRHETEDDDLGARLLSWMASYAQIDGQWPSYVDLMRRS